MGLSIPKMFTHLRRYTSLSPSRPALFCILGHGEVFRHGLIWPVAAQCPAGSWVDIPMAIQKHNEHAKSDKYEVQSYLSNLLLKTMNRRELQIFTSGEVGAGQSAFSRLLVILPYGFVPLGGLAPPVDCKGAIV